MSPAAAPQSTDPRVSSYLDSLARALSALPGGVRSEVYDEIRQHIDDELAQRAGDPTAVPDILDRLGDPDEIAREAGGDQPPVPAAASRRQEIVALILLSVGGFLGPLAALALSRAIHGGTLFGVALLIGVIGWLVGVILLWTSRRFSSADKAVGTFLVPGGFAGGLAVVALALFAPVDEQTCHQGTIVSDHGHVTSLTSTCSGGPPWWVVVISVVVAVVAILGPVYTTIRLGRRVAQM